MTAIRISWTGPESTSGVESIVLYKKEGAENCEDTLNGDLIYETRDLGDGAFIDEISEKGDWRYAAFSKNQYTLSPCATSKYSVQPPLVVSPEKSIVEYTYNEDRNFLESPIAAFAGTAIDKNGEPDYNIDLDFLITGGDDAEFFEIRDGVDLPSFTALLYWRSQPDYENPKDSNSDNSYQLELEVSDGTLGEKFHITVKLENVVEATEVEYTTTNGLFKYRFSAHAENLHLLTETNTDPVHNALEFWDTMIQKPEILGSNPYSIELVIYYERRGQTFLAAAMNNEYITVGGGRTFGAAFASGGYSIVNIDYIDRMLNNIGSDGKTEFESTMIHEICHVLGIGTLWGRRVFSSTLSGTPLVEYQEDGQSKYYYIGENGLREYKSYMPYIQNNILGIPIEDDGGPGTAGGHVEEGTLQYLSGPRIINGEYYPGLDREIMTGWSEGSNSAPVSRVTLGMLADIGYKVNYSLAEDYTLVVNFIDWNIGLSSTPFAPKMHYARIDQGVFIPILGSKFSHADSGRPSRIAFFDPVSGEALDVTHISFNDEGTILEAELPVLNSQMNEAPFLSLDPEDQSMKLRDGSGITEGLKKIIRKINKVREADFSYTFDLNKKIPFVNPAAKFGGVKYYFDPNARGYGSSLFLVPFESITGASDLALDDKYGLHCYNNQWKDPPSTIVFTPKAVTRSGVKFYFLKKSSSTAVDMILECQPNADVVISDGLVAQFGEDGGWYVETISTSTQASDPGILLRYDVP